MAPTHQDHPPGDHHSRSGNRALPDPWAPGDLPEIDPDRGIWLEALFLAALMLLCAVSTVWGWLA